MGALDIPVHDEKLTALGVARTCVVAPCDEDVTLELVRMVKAEKFDIHPFMRHEIGGIVTHKVFMQPHPRQEEIAKPAFSEGLTVQGPTLVSMGDVCLEGLSEELINLAVCKCGGWEKGLSMRMKGECMRVGRIWKIMAILKIIWQY